MAQYNRPFLKWAGGKYRLLPHLLPLIGEGNCFIEPFVGAGVVFLNTQFKRYILNDSNTDLIHVYKTLQKHGKKFIDYTKEFFGPHNNTKERYYLLRDRFNHAKKTMEKAALFIYLNRHGYNGLCRYSRRSGFNVPFGAYKNSPFPEDSMRFFYEKSQSAEFITSDFTDVMEKARKQDVVYCDPPYLPREIDAYAFTQYHSLGFSLEQQKHLAQLAQTLKQRGSKVILSNHHNAVARELYQHANQYNTVEVTRTISCNIDQRDKVSEMIAVFE